MENEALIKMTIKQTMERCADIVAAITADDLLSTQSDLLASGVPLIKLAGIDRADVAVSFLRAQAAQIE